MPKQKINTKEEARQYAIDWQQWISQQNLSYSELLEWQDIFTELGHIYGLEAEYIENGII